MTDLYAHPTIKIIEEWARSTHTSVHLAEHVDGQKSVLKILHETQLQGLEPRDQDWLKTCFQEEMTSLKALTHDSVPRFIHTCDQLPDATGFFMTRVEGQPLSSTISDSPTPLTLERFFMDLLEILDHCHTKNGSEDVSRTFTGPRLHRDISATNVIFKRHEPMAFGLVDFGTSMSQAEANQHDRWVGPFGGMAPEVAGEYAYSVQSDLFNLGAVTYHWLVGEQLHGDQGAANQLAQARRYQAPPNLRRWVRAGRLRTLLEALLSPHVCDRPASAQDALSIL